MSGNEVVGSTWQVDLLSLIGEQRENGFQSGFAILPFYQ